MADKTTTEQNVERGWLDCPNGCSQIGQQRGDSYCTECGTNLEGYASHQPTIDEQVLTELRAKFPGKAVRIRRELEFYPGDFDSGPEELSERAVIKIGYTDRDPKFEGPTLNAAMERARVYQAEPVRQWHAEQGKESR